jgi:hypothetical protein
MRRLRDVRLTMDVRFAPLANWQDFEELTVALFEEVHGVFQPQRYGLQGQPQHGVDVIGQSGGGEWLAAQCKRLQDKNGRDTNKPGGAITESLLRDEVAKADDYGGKIDRYILVTTGSTQPQIQALAQRITAGRQADDRFAVSVLFWEDFERALNRNQRLRERFAGKLLKPLKPAAVDREILELIASAFRRRAFRDPLSVEHRTNFKQAISDVLRAIDTGVLVNRDGGVERFLNQGYAGISDPQLRAQCQRVRDQLDGFNVMFLTAEREGLLRQDDEWLYVFDRGLYEQLSEARAACVRTLNAIIAPFDIAPI